MRNPINRLRRLAQRITPRSLGTVTHVSTDEPAVALTFDDGPHPLYTPRLLEILARHGAHATFFMVGESAQRNGEIVRQVAEAGHAIGNHSWDHPSLPRIGRSERLDQMRRCREVLEPYGAAIFRPPYGDQSLLSRIDAYRLGYTVVTWNLVAQDWLAHSAERIAARVGPLLQPGCVVLFHDALYTMGDEAFADRTPALDAVDLLLAEFSGRYRFVTVPALLAMGRAQVRGWYKRTDRGYLNARIVAAGTARRY